MAVYIVTGKLGSGKGLVSVGRIKDYLSEGRPVATNLDINLHNMFPKHFKNQRLIRLPDQPSIIDLEIIGYGNKGYDENKNGLLCLDECATWFNARSFSDKSRAPIIDWLLHARKYGWDVIFQIQNISLLDKQARDALAEMVVYCRRLDRLPIPFIGWFINMFIGKVKLFKLHVGAVFYGSGLHAPKVDTWFYYGTSLYSCYDTKQIFSPMYPHAIHSVLPGWYTHRNEISQKNWGFYMRMTKIYFKRFRSIYVFVFGFALCFGLVSFFHGDSSASVKGREFYAPPKAIYNDGRQLDYGVPSSPIAAVKPLEFDRVKINYVRFKKGNKTLTRYMFGGGVYDPSDFPYKVEWNNNFVFAFIPVEIAEN